VFFQQTPVFVGQTASARAEGHDQFGAPIGTGSVSWSTGSASIATVNASGGVTGVAPGQTTLTATSGAAQTAIPIVVAPVPVASVGVTPTTATIAVGATQQLTATTFDASNNDLGRPVTWSSSDPSRVTVSGTGLVTGLAGGVAVISAASEGKSGSAQITVTAAQVTCTSANALQLTVGEVHTLSTAEKDALCVGGGAAASEYALIPFYATSVFGSNISLTLTATGTSQIQPGALASVQVSQGPVQATPEIARDASELQFRERERRDVGSRIESFRRAPTSGTSALSPTRLWDPSCRSTPRSAAICAPIRSRFTVPW